MTLPGGVWTRNGLDRSFAFKPLSGHVELAIAEHWESNLPWPRRITLVLTSALESLAGNPATAETVEHLSVGDRQFLLCQLGSLLVDDVLWHSQPCAGCGEPLDLPVRYRDFPVKFAGDTFPFATVRTSVREQPIRFRVPNGRDELVLVTAEDVHRARAELASRLVAEDLETSSWNFSNEDVRLIESAIEEVAPEVGLEGVATCPACGHEGSFEFDLFSFGQWTNTGRLLEEVYRLASACGWSEREILGLPRWRRHAYLELADRSRGLLTRQEAFVP